jgi:hypothetical protein
MHYTTYGKATTDRSKIGLKFAKTPPKTILNTMALINASLSIPQGAADYTIDNTMTFNRETVIYSMIPHTHVRGTAWHYEATYPDGRTEVILSVPKYDFNWQHEYVFTQPWQPAGTKPTPRRGDTRRTTSRTPIRPTGHVGDRAWEMMTPASPSRSRPPRPPRLRNNSGERDARDSARGAGLIGRPARLSLAEAGDCASLGRCSFDVRSQMPHRWLPVWRPRSAARTASSKARWAARFAFACCSRTTGTASS